MLPDIRPIPVSQAVRALFYCWQIPTGKAVVLFDRDGPTSITNDAEAVVTSILAARPGVRIFYRDTIGGWAELLHDGHKFTAFEPCDYDSIRRLMPPTPATYD